MGLAYSGQTEDLTALQLIKEANRYVGEQAKNKVVQVRSEKSVGSLTPAIWYVVFYDPTATFKAVEVKFGAGKMLDVKRPFRLLEPIRGDHKPLDSAQLKTDSNEAIKTAAAEPLLENLTLKATAAKLERGDGGAVVWKIRLWAAKLRNPNQQVEVGEVIISAETGELLKSDLHINRVD